MINNKEYFNNKLIEGENAERDFKEYLEGRGWTVEMTTGNFHAYDLIASRDGLDIKFEIKCNSGIEKYKTAFMETFQSGYPSALAITEADWIIHYSEYGEVRGLSTVDMKKYIQDNKLPLSNTKMKTSGGYVSGSGYRIPWNDMKLIKQ